MQRYLILYGESNDMATFDAEDFHHAIEQFVNWAPVSPDEQANRNSITEVCLVLPIVTQSNLDDNVVVYATSNSDGSWFGAEDLELVAVPADIQDSDEVEDFIVNHHGKG